MQNYKAQNGCHNCRHLKYAYDSKVCGLKCNVPKHPKAECTLEARRAYHERCLKLNYEFGVAGHGICDLWEGQPKQPERTG